MKALLCERFGPADQLVVRDVPDLVPGDQEAVLRVRAAGVNFPDTLIIENRYQFKPELPFAPGGECAGVVESVGARVPPHVVPGMRAIAFTTYGAFAEQVRVPARNLVPMPDGMDFEVASAFTIAYATTYHALVDRAAMKAGETLLVLGASGGVGLAAVEIGKALGARVIAAASSPEKLAICAEHGADHTIDYEREDLRERVKELTSGAGVDVVYDPVGGRTTEIALRASAWRGRFLVIGFAAGDIPNVPANLLLLKGASLVGVFWGDYARREPGRVMQDLQTLFGWIREGRLRPRIAGRYPLERGAEAIAALAARKVSGKLVITMATAADG
ncbi:MAG TPA: NADPH:quinone oxidoreductase family protein [Kofleriaceae bacterium]|nr:NADPH:quinone oxidoreductase family protein [Kofleriaceae bacterium]